MVMAFLASVLSCLCRLGTTEAGNLVDMDTREKLCKLGYDPQLAAEALRLVSFPLHHMHSPSPLCTWVLWAEHICR